MKFSLIFIFLAALSAEIGSTFAQSPPMCASRAYDKIGTEDGTVHSFSLKFLDRRKNDKNYDSYLRTIQNAANKFKVYSENGEYTLIADYSKDVYYSNKARALVDFITFVLCERGMEKENKCRNTNYHIISGYFDENNVFVAMSDMIDNNHVVPNCVNRR